MSVAPYFEDDIRATVDLLGLEPVLYGSDFPHAEGLRHPLDYVGDLAGFAPHEVRAIMRDNPRKLVER